MKLFFKAVFITMILIATGVASTATHSTDGRDEICHRDGCKGHHNNDYIQHVLLISFDGPTSLREENQSQVSVTIENECNTGKSQFNTFDWVDLVLTSVNGKTTIFDETQRITNMGRGGGNRRTITWTIEGKDPGSDTLFVDIHAWNSHEDSDKYESGEFDIDITPKPPDIVVSIFPTNPTEPVEGALVNISTGITNTGSPASWDIIFFLDDVVEDERTVDLARDESFDLFWDWDSSGQLGDHTIRVEASGVSEEEELSDNSMEVQFYVMTRPDVEVLNISYDPSEPVDGEVVTIVAFIRNEGEGSATFRMDLCLDTPDNTIGTESVTLGGFEYQNITYFWVPTKQVGEHQFIIRSDPDDEVNETDETNNDLGRGIEVMPPPIQSDPSIHKRDIQFPGFILEGDLIQITIAVRNLGNSSLNLTSRIFMVGAENITLEDFQIHLEPHEVRLLTTQWNTSLRTGNWSAGVLLFGTDPEDERTHNNLAYSELVIMRRPDPAIISLNWTPFNPLYHSGILVNVTVVNFGDDAVEFLSTIIMGDERYVQSHYLYPGQETIISQPMTFDGPGIISVDLGWAIPWERDRTNNHIETMVEAFVSQDLRIDSFTIGQPPGYFGDTQRISATISNSWTLNGTGELIVRSNGDIFTTFSLSIPAEKNRTYWMDWIPPYENFTFTASLIVPLEDPVGPGDHYRKFDFNPGPPEVSLGMIGLSPSTLRSKDEVNAHVVVNNRGDTGTNVTLSFKVDGFLMNVWKIYVPGRTQVIHTILWVAVTGDHDIHVSISAIEEGTVQGAESLDRSVSVGEVIIEEDNGISQSLVFILLLNVSFVISITMIIRQVRKGVVP